MLRSETSPVIPRSETSPVIPRSEASPVIPRSEASPVIPRSEATRDLLLEAAAMNHYNNFPSAAEAANFLTTQ